MRIILAAGGTAGPVVPLLAVAKKIREDHPEAEFLLIGSKNGPEAVFAIEAGIKFESIPAGKLNRYFSWQNFIAPFKVLAGFVRAISLVRGFKADLVFGAGGYASVPVGLAAFVLGRKIVIHQQDVEPTLSNRILAPFASKISVSFEQSLKDFNSGTGLDSFNRSQKIIWTGNPFREELLRVYTHEELKELRLKFGVTEEIPILLFFGGGTGAMALNKILEEILPQLVKFAYVIHSSGAGKRINFSHPRYWQQELIVNMPEALAIADLLVCRAGLSTITEISALQKVAIVIPMPNSHQIYNALMLKEADAAIVLNQEYLSGPELVSIIRKLMYDIELQNQLRSNASKIMPRNATQKIATILVELCQKP